MWGNGRNNWTSPEGANEEGFQSHLQCRETCRCDKAQATCSTSPTRARAAALGMVRPSLHATNATRNEYALGCTSPAAVQGLILFLAIIQHYTCDCDPKEKDSHIGMTLLTLKGQNLICLGSGMGSRLPTRQPEGILWSWKCLYLKAAAASVVGIERHPTASGQHALQNVSVRNRETIWGFLGQHNSEHKGNLSQYTKPSAWLSLNKTLFLKRQ